LGNPIPPEAYVDAFLRMKEVQEAFLVGTAPESEQEHHNPKPGSGSGFY
jgi:hypothetical protein